MANFPSRMRSGVPSMRSNDPVRELQSRIDRLFDEVGSSWTGGWNQPELSVPDFAPACDIDETDTHILMSFDLPGMKREDIHIELMDNELRISGERKEEHEEKTRAGYRSERYYGTFERSFTLPASIKPDQVETEYSDGVLRIAVPKQEARKGEQIQIGEGKPGLFQRLKGQKKLGKAA